MKVKKLDEIKGLRIKKKKIKKNGATIKEKSLKRQVKLKKTKCILTF